MRWKSISPRRTCVGYLHAAGTGSDRQAILSNLERLTEALEDAETVTVTVDEQSVTLAVPRAAAVDRESGVFGLDDSVALTRRWWLDEA